MYLINENTRVCIRHFEEADVFRFSTTTKLKSRQDNLPAATSKKMEINLSKRVRNKKRCVSQFYGFKPTFLIENFWNNDKKICLYTGIPSRQIFIILYNFVFKSEKDATGTVHQTHSTSSLIRPHKISPLNELFLTMIRLRKGIDYHMLGDMFWTSDSAACRIVNVWINLLYKKLGTPNIFPNKTVLMENAPQSFLNKYPNVIGSIDCTEFMIETPSSLIRQSQCFFHYKGTNTLKALIMINANGAIIFVSALHTV